MSMIEAQHAVRTIIEQFLSIHTPADFFARLAKMDEVTLAGIGVFAIILHNVVKHHLMVRRGVEFTDVIDMRVKHDHGEAFKTTFNAAEKILRQGKGFISAVLKADSDDSSCYQLRVQWRIAGDHIEILAVRGLLGPFLESWILKNLTLPSH